MANFPRREADIKALAQTMIAGLHNNPDFPAPPINGNELKQLLDEFNALDGEQRAAQAAAQQITEAKQAKLDQLTAAMKKDLHYAEDAVDGNDAKLAALGWGGKAAPTALQAPGQPRSLEAAKEGPGWLFLDWKKATDGGKAAFYRIERRELPSGTWAMVGTALEVEVMLTDQERGKEYEYRVVAVNKAGESGTSNTVTAVL